MTLDKFKLQVDGLINDFVNGASDEKEFRDGILDLLIKVAEPHLKNKAIKIDDGKLWSKIRTLLSQGGAIQQDYDAGKYKNFEEYNIRLDGAARERINFIKEMFI